MLEITFKMFVFFKTMFIGLLSFSGSLLTKFMSLNNEQCEARPALTDLDPAEFNYYLLMI